MTKDVARRLKLLEHKVPTIKKAELKRILELGRSGKLDTANLSELTEEQLWWLAAQEPMELKRA